MSKFLKIIFKIIKWFFGILFSLLLVAGAIQVISNKQNSKLVSEICASHPVGSPFDAKTFVETYHPQLSGFSAPIHFQVGELTQSISKSSKIRGIDYAELDKMTGDVTVIIGIPLKQVCKIRVKDGLVSKSERSSFD